MHTTIDAPSRPERSSTAAEMIAAYRAGSTIGEVADRFRVSPRVVSLLVSAARVDVRRRRVPRPVVAR